MGATLGTREGRTVAWTTALSFPRAVPAVFAVVPEYAGVSLVARDLLRLGARASRGKLSKRLQARYANLAACAAADLAVVASSEQLFRVRTALLEQPRISPAWRRLVVRLDRALECTAKACASVLAATRDEAIEASATPVDVVEAVRTYYQRSAVVRAYVLARAAGRCESCSAPAPFLTPDGLPFLETHHTIRVCDGGPDHPQWVAAICPNCHREIHYGAHGAARNEALMERLRGIECAAGAA